MSEAAELTAAEVASLSEVLGKCVNPATGEPVSARREETAVLPVSGSRVGAADGNGKGTCPLCGTLVGLSGKGFVTAHRVRNMPESGDRARFHGKDGKGRQVITSVKPKNGVRLVERAADVTDSGSRTGSPDAAMRTRAAELSGVVVAAWHPPMVWADTLPTVKVKMVRTWTDADGKARRKTETVDVPQTEDNVRTAIRQEQARKPRAEYVKDRVTGERRKTGRMIPPDNAGTLARLGSILKALTRSEAVPVIGAEPGTYRVREAVTVDDGTADSRDVRASVAGVADGRVTSMLGTALVQGRSMPALTPEEVDGMRETSKGKPRNAIGWSEPVGRVRADKVAVSGTALTGAECEGKGCTVAGCVAVVGGRYGKIPCHVYRAMPQRQRQRYWQGVSRRKASVAKAVAARHAQHEWVRSEVKRLRELGDSLATGGQVYGGGMRPE